MTIETHFWATNGDNKNSPLTMAARQPSRQKLESSFSLPPRSSGPSEPGKCEIFINMDWAI